MEYLRLLREINHYYMWGANLITMDSKLLHLKVKKYLQIMEVKKSNHTGYRYRSTFVSKLFTSVSLPHY